MSDNCGVSLNAECIAPPGTPGRTTRATCFACGGPACTGCSKIKQHAGYGRRRVCNDCAEQWKK